MRPNPECPLYILRNIQFILTVIYIILIIYAALNPGKWLDLKESLGLILNPLITF